MSPNGVISTREHFSPFAMGQRPSLWTVFTVLFISYYHNPLANATEIMRTKNEKQTMLPVSGARARIADMNSDLAVIITHPWGPLGGNMHNNVVISAAMFFQALGVTTLRMDFATSQISRGYKEVGQVIEAANFVLSGQHINDNGPGSHSENDDGGRSSEETNQRRNPTSILLVGYSYGSLIAGSASAGIPACIGSVSIAPPVDFKNWLLLFNAGHHVRQAQKRKTLPRLFVIGTEDNFSSQESFRNFVDGFPDDSTSAALIKHSDHFFNGSEKDLMNVVGQWLLTTYEEVLGGDLKRLGTKVLSKYADESSCVSTEKEEESSYRCFT